MSQRELRKYIGHNFNHITNHCINNEQLMHPTDENISETIGGVLASVHDKFQEVQIVDYVFMSGHFDLIARGPSNNPTLLSAFMQELGCQLTKRLNHLHGRRGTMWQGRFSSTPIVDNGALRERLKYILSQAINEGQVAENVAEQVAEPGELPCLSSLPTRLGESQVFERQWSKGPSTHHEIKLSRLPRALLRTVGRSLTQAEWYQQLLDEIHAESDRMSTKVEQAPEKAEHKRNKRIPKPKCYWTDERAKQRYMRAYKKFNEEYRQASQELLAGNAAAVFPVNSFRPVLGANWQAQAFPLPRGTQAVLTRQEDGSWAGSLVAHGAAAGAAAGTAAG